jgi:hypothetical protein
MQISPYIDEKINNEIDKIKLIGSEKEQSFIKDIRVSAFMIVSRYAILKSFLWTTVTALLACILIPRFMIKTFLVYISKKDFKDTGMGFCAQLVATSIFLFGFSTPQYSSLPSNNVTINEVVAYTAMRH